MLNGAETVFEIGKKIGIATNNDAEYQAFLCSLEWLVQQPSGTIDSVSWKLDSKLVVEQLNKKWKIKEPRIQKYAQECWKHLNALSYPFTITHVLREKNKRADFLVNEALDQA